MQMQNWCKKPQVTHLVVCRCIFIAGLCPRTPILVASVPQRKCRLGSAFKCNNCDRMDCSNKLQTSAAEVRLSELLPGEDGLFAARHIKRGEWIASFGVLARLDGGVGGRAKRGYIIPITETGSRRLVYVTPIDGVGARYKAYTMNHTCSEEHRNAELTHTGEIGLGAQVPVRACKDITANQ